MSEFMRTMLPSRDFTPQVQALRKYMHEALGWDYRASSVPPLGFKLLTRAAMLRSETAHFNFKGEVQGRSFQNQSFTLTDVTAIADRPEQKGFSRFETLSAQDDIFDCPFDATDDYNAGFQGVVLALPHLSKFLGRTLICSDKGRLNPKKRVGLKRVGFVSSEFEKKFEVYSDDQVEARALITPDFMERLNTFHDDYLGRHVQCAFLQDHFIVMVNIDDRFAFSKDFKALDFQESSTRIIHEIGSIFYLLEKVQALQARIGAAGEEGADKARAAFYKSLLSSLIPAVKASESQFQETDKWTPEQRATLPYFDEMTRLLLGPTF